MYATDQLGVSPTLQVYAIHRKIFTSLLIVRDSWPNFLPSSDCRQFMAEFPLWTCMLLIHSALASLYKSKRFIAKFSPLY